ncbi:hypothetical protein QJQ45_014051 [Haematococcus lacustris]|nr:hypothetical protein QJQ45_014051 [Haematococcus lacustris]
MLPCRHGPRPWVKESRRSAAACRSAATSSGAGPSTSGSTAESKHQNASWSDRLKLAAKKRSQQRRGPVPDIYSPSVRISKQANYIEGTDFEDEEGGEGDYGSSEPGHKRLPAEMRCFDTATIYVKAGDGGNGCVAFRREAHVEMGGPAGGSAGRGGNVWAVADTKYNSLFNFRTKVHWRAKNGGNGTGANCDGADASDLFIPVPLGTIVRRKGADEGEPPLAELLKEGEKALLLVGGRGGRGNSAFKTSRNNAPTIAERGEKGPEAWMELELKVVADCGIVGVPNAGKSTLLSVLTAARPKIANYPFTTLVPNLGVCERDFRTTVFADVPGLLEGAHEGLGLGHEFLRHVKRCRALVHVIDGTSPDPLGDWDAINLELELFSPDLKDKPQAGGGCDEESPLSTLPCPALAVLQLVAYNKMDVPESSEFWEDVREGLLARGLDPGRLFAVSAATGSGVTELVRGVHQLLDALGPAEVVLETEALNRTAVPRQRPIRVGDFHIEVEEVAGAASPAGGPLRLYHVEGEGVVRVAQMTNWNYWDAVRRFQRVLEVSGVSASLRARGIREGDTVVIGSSEFEWRDDRSESAMYDAWATDMAARGQEQYGTLTDAGICFEGWD